MTMFDRLVMLTVVSLLLSFFTLVFIFSLCLSDKNEKPEGTKEKRDKKQEDR